MEERPISGLNRRTILAMSAGTAAAGVLAACSSGTARQHASQQDSASGPSSAPTGSASGSSLGAATIGLTYIPNVQFSPFYVAMQQGLFARAGVRATLRHHGATEGLFTAMQSGTEQFVIAGGDELLQARASGMDLVAIASYYRTYPVRVIVPQASAISSLGDLKGRTVGVPGRYGETWFGLLAALKNAGLSRSDMTVKEIGYTQQAALATHKVDAVVGFSNNDAVQFALNNIPVRELALGRSVPLVSIVLATTSKILSAQPELARAVANTTISAISAVVADPAGAVETSTKYIPGLAGAAALKAARATLDATIACFKGPDGAVSGRLDAAAWTAMTQFMTSAGLLAHPVTASSAFRTGVVSS